ncbi:hypothetical protein SDC9_200029 [bioreactor metagenome]|uniref:Uncharacterized protein n=1 Tax=bioreactor metagenome TaxID=1076179 RepID=A0A645IM45_9ZZZZ
MLPVIPPIIIPIPPITKPIEVPYIPIIKETIDPITGKQVIIMAINMTIFNG